MNQNYFEIYIGKKFKHLSIVQKEKKACLASEKLFSVAVSPLFLLLILPDW